MNARLLLAVALLVAALPAPSGRADDRPLPGAKSSPAAAKPATTPDDEKNRWGLALPDRVEKQHMAMIAGHPLAYRTVVEKITLVNGKGEPTASIFAVAYIADHAAGPRPVAFVFNGGPGAASVYLHLGALGPRVLDTPPSGAVPNPPFRLIDNPSTWLAFTDLVFVDPVGTGFSRAEGKGEDRNKPFWNVKGDLQSLAAVVRRWLDRHDRWGSPLFLVGESYGGLRAAGLARTLSQDEGVAVSGLVLVSPALDTELLHFDISNTLAPAFELPSEAASAAALAGKSPTEAAAAAEAFALSDYVSGLTRIAGIPAINDPLIARVSTLTGLPAWVVQSERGRVPAGQFVHELRRPQHQILSRYDATVARAAAANPWDDETGDPILEGGLAAFTSAFGDYAINELGYRTELRYKVLADQVGGQWNWDDARKGDDSLGLALTSLQQTLLARPKTKVLVVNGRYDLVTPYLASRWLIDQLSLPPDIRKDIRLRVYEGGHMMYMRPKSREALFADARQLFADAMAPK